MIVKGLGIADPIGATEPWSGGAPVLQGDDALAAILASSPGHASPTNTGDASGLPAGAAAAAVQAIGGIGIVGGIGLALLGLWILSRIAK